MILSKLITPKLTYRLPFYVLLPVSAFFYPMDYFLYVSSAQDVGIYQDVTFRLGMSPGFALFYFGFLVGSLFLLYALAVLAADCIKARRLDWRGLLFVLLGAVSHPWVCGAIWFAVFKY